jgi:transposase
MCTLACRFQAAEGARADKKTVVAAIIVPKGKRGWLKETRTFGTMMADILELSDWLQAHAVTHVAMESTGEYCPTGIPGILIMIR